MSNAQIGTRKIKSINIGADEISVAVQDNKLLYQGYTEGLAFTKDSYYATAEVSSESSSGVTSPEVVITNKAFLASTSEVLPVDSIGQGAFAYNSYVKNVSLAESVQNIKYRAFYECSNLHEVQYKNTVTIGNNAFENSTIEYMNLNNISSIGNYAFSNCANFVGSFGHMLTIGTSLRNANTRAFYNCTGLLPSFWDPRYGGITYAGNLSEWLSISFSNLWGNPLQYSGYLRLDNALGEAPLSIDASGITRTYMGNSFRGWLGTDLKLPNYTYMNAIPLTDARNLINLSIPFVGDSANTRVGDTTQFPFGCLFNSRVGSSEGSIYTNESAKAQAGLQKVVQHYTYAGSDPQTFTCYIPQSLQKVDVRGGDLLNYSFENCSMITYINVYNYTCNAIGTRSFYNCSNLYRVTLPSSLTNIGPWAFCYCANLAHIEFDGTKAQWNAISKDYNWNASTGSYIIHCTDGDLPK